jgi:hypothetical protein
MLVQTGCTDRWEKPVPASEWPTPADGRGSKHNGHSPVHRHLGSSSLPKMELTCFSTVDEDRVQRLLDSRRLSCLCPTGPTTS